MSIPNALMIILGLKKNCVSIYLFGRRRLCVIRILINQKLQKFLDNSKKNSVAKSTKNLVIPYQFFSKKTQNKLGTGSPLITPPLIVLFHYSTIFKQVPKNSHSTILYCMLLSMYYLFLALYHSYMAIYRGSLIVLFRITTYFSET